MRPWILDFTYPDYRRRGIARGFYAARHDRARRLGLKAPLTVGMLTGDGMEYVYKQYIDGEWVGSKSGRTSEVRNPATEEVIRTLPFGDADDCSAAIEAAEVALIRRL